MKFSNCVIRMVMRHVKVRKVLDQGLIDFTIDKRNEYGEDTLS